MNLPTVPTDNLYKFLSIAGTAIVILSLYFLYDNISKNEDRVRIYETENKLLAKQQEIIAEKLGDIKYEADLLTKRHELDVPLLTYEAQDTVFTYTLNTTGTPDQIRASERVLQLVKEYKERYYENELKKEEINILKARIEKYGDTYPNRIEIISCSLAIAGVFIAEIGFLLWFYKTQKPSDEVLLYDMRTKGIWPQNCQSCGSFFHNLYKLKGTKADGSTSNIFCVDCYIDGEFTESDLCLNDVKKRAKQEIKSWKLLKIAQTMKKLEGLERWSYRKF